jgi:single-strand DNA-binding protein
MSKSVNKVLLIGNLGKDPEIKYAPSGTAVAKFSMATNERFKNKSGEWQDRTEWHNLVAFQRTAEIVGEYAHKGAKIYIEGRLQTSSWEDKQTREKKYRTEIVVQEILLLGGRPGNGDDAEPASDHERYRHQPSAPEDDRYSEESHGAPGEITDEDIPF